MDAANQILELRDSIQHLESTRGDTCFTENEILAIGTKIVDLRDSVSLQSRVIENLNTQVFLYERLHMQDSVEIAYRIQQIDLMEGMMDRYKLELEIVKPKWYQSKWVYFIGGAATVYVSAVVLDKIK